MEYGLLRQAARKTFVAPVSSLATTAAPTIDSIDFSRVATGQLGILVEQPSGLHTSYQLVDNPTVVAAAKYSLIQGVHKPEQVRRILHSNADNNVKRSVKFKAKDIVGWSGKRAKIAATSQKVALGWDGKNAEKDFKVKAYEDTLVHMKVWGGPITKLLGHSDQEWRTTFVINRECFDEYTETSDQPLSVEGSKVRAVDEFLRTYRQRKIGGQFLHEYVSATKISTAAAPSGLTTYDTFQLVIPDNGDNVSLGAVQAKYPTLAIARDSFANGYSTYTVTVADGTAAPADFTNEAITTLAFCATCPPGYTADGDICTLTDPTTFDWVAGVSVTRASKTLRITLADDICGTSRLADLQAAYPLLTITGDASAVNCVRNYSTTILSEPVEPGCHPDYYRFETYPESFEGSVWEELPVTVTEPANIGIIFEGNIFKKPFKSSLIDFSTDDPSNSDGVHIEISTYSNNWLHSGCEDSIPVTTLSNYEYPAGEGWFVREMEKETASREKDSYIQMPAVRDAFGQELYADPNKFYDAYFLTVHVDEKNGAFDPIGEDTHLIITYFEVGKGQAYEDAINALITDLGDSAEVETFTLFE